ncbi:MAG TPA: ABC transporter permease [Anaerovoracaceae bacterium]|nr:ABC transporter permease [Anaerovoracaceae bacterium]
MKKLINDPSVTSTLNKRFVINNTMGVLLAIIVFSIFVGYRSDTFFSLDNFIAVSRICSITVLVGLSQMVVMAGGGLNVSVGAIGGLGAVVCGALIKRTGIPWEFAIFLGICIGVVCGAINGFTITRLGSTSEIAWLTTIATMALFTGFSLGITHAKPFYDMPKGYDWIGAYNIFGVLSFMLVVMIVFAVIIWAMFKYTSLGRQILAVGGNQKAATLSGINVTKILIFKHIISGVLAASAGILFSTRLGAVNADIGLVWILFSFAAPLIGGTRMEGGQVNVLGAVLGGVLLALVSNGVVHMRINIFIVEFMEGLIILLAVGLDRLRAMREENLERSERSAI